MRLCFPFSEPEACFDVPSGVVNAPCMQIKCFLQMRAYESPDLRSASAGVPPWRPEALSDDDARDTGGRAGAVDSTNSECGNAQRLSWGSCGRARVQTDRQAEHRQY
jgi:hypothetical protein